MEEPPPWTSNRWAPCPRAARLLWIAPGEKHWHGAGPDTAMVHIALQEHLDGTHVTWLEKVSDEQYDAKVS